MSDAVDVARARQIFEDALNVAAPEPDVDIIASGLIDSLALVTLIFELEQEFEVQVPLESLEVDDFRTITNIVKTISSLQGQAST